MEVADILSRGCTRSAVPCTSKKRALEIISELAAEHLNIGSQPLFDCLLAREKMGSTGIGNGIAIPHGRISDDNKATAVLLTFAEPVEFDAIDNQPVGLVFALLVPEQECKQHLKTLSLIAEKLSNKQVCRQLRQAGSDEELYQIMISA
ncbi:MULTISPECIES: PTS IIA-like nitrogen regulatory protein PtsN [Oceanimonas]|uniref:Nitrogen regulatory protein n=1 Tax=Oceanimonas doudoroffii TaxID=84158 RepID=A0A233RCS5_9GAMM|nr:MULTISPECIES: PTS IIA-like nitrogen regulatory protein PtsN [Oceanimonas]NHI01157.1 Nitrogen regulatory protein [Oceanimonas sp. MB9]OXY81195.1 PTS IIA-like nitrogen regulatory protein PtsN [Oceanimonas doudoroffii]